MKQLLPRVSMAASWTTPIDLIRANLRLRVAPSIIMATMTPLSPISFPRHPWMLKLGRQVVGTVTFTTLRLASRLSFGRPLPTRSMVSFTHGCPIRRKNFGRHASTEKSMRVGKSL